MSERPLEIPNYAGWPSRKLSTLCDPITRGTAPVYVEQSSVLAIGQRCVSRSGFSQHHARPHSERAMSNVVEPVNGDVLLNSTGTGTIGRSCVFTDLRRFIVDGHVTLLRPQKQLATGEWANEVLRSFWGQSHLERFCYAGSTNQIELSKSDLTQTILPTPPLDEQQCFVAIFRVIDTAIQRTEAIIEKLKQVKQGLLHDLLTRGIDANGELRPPADEAPELYQDSPLGRIPKEWRVSAIEDFLDQIIDYRGKTPAKTDSGTPLITAKNVRMGYVDPEPREFIANERFSSWMTRGVPQKGDVLFTTEAPLGNAAQIETDDRLAFAQRMIILQCNHGLVNTYLKYLLLSEGFRGRLFSFGSGSTVEGIQQSTFRKIRISVPVSRQEQLDVVTQMTAMDAKIDMELTGLKKYRLQKSGLMDDLLTGRVRVTDLLAASSG